MRSSFYMIYMLTGSRGDRAPVNELMSRRVAISRLYDMTKALAIVSALWVSVAGAQVKTIDNPGGGRVYLGALAGQRRRKKRLARWCIR